jgi:hypothetical protein
VKKAAAHADAAAGAKQQQVSVHACMHACVRSFSGYIANFQPPPSEHSHGVDMHACMHSTDVLFSQFSCMALPRIATTHVLGYRSTYYYVYRAMSRRVTTGAAQRWTARPPRRRMGATKTRRRRRRRPRLLLLLLPRPRAWRSSGRTTRTSWTSPGWTTRPPRESLPSTTEWCRCWWWLGYTNGRPPAQHVSWCAQLKY